MVARSRREGTAPRALQFPANDSSALGQGAVTVRAEVAKGLWAIPAIQPRQPREECHRLARERHTVLAPGLHPCSNRGP